jgi:hypothetical protein
MVILFVLHTVNGIGFNPAVLRIVHLSRLLRLAPDSFKLPPMQSLVLLSESLVACLPTIFWTFILMLLLQIVAAMCITQSLNTYMQNSDNDQESRQAVFNYWGTFPRCMLTMFEIAFGNRVDPFRLLFEQVNECYLVFYILYRCCICFAVMHVIAAVFVAETFKVASSSCVGISVGSSRQRGSCIRKLNQAAKRISAEGNKALSPKELEQLLQAVSPSDFFTPCLGKSEIAAFCKQLSNGDGKVRLENLLEGLTCAQSPATNLDQILALASLDFLHVKLDTLLRIRSYGSGFETPQNINGAQKIAS